jgi:thiamine pyrophosphokinase
MELIPREIIGDMDSIDEITTKWAKEHSILMTVHPAEKDMTDSEICLRGIPEQADILVVLSLTGRIDHVMSNIMIAGKMAQSKRKIMLTDGMSWIRPVSGPGSFRVDINRWNKKERKELAISLMPIFGQVENVHLEGLHYQLSGQTLVPGSSYSISNRLETVDDAFTVAFSSGVVLIIITVAD